MDAVTVAGRPSKRKGNQLAVHKAVCQGRGRVRRNVTKAIADVSKPERAKREGGRRAASGEEKKNTKVGAREQREGGKWGKEERAEEREGREMKRQRGVNSRLPEIRQYPQPRLCAAG